VFLNFQDALNPADSAINWREPRWVNFYGVPEGTTTKGLTQEVEYAKKMLDGVIPGSNFRGRVLMSMSANKVTDPKVKCTLMLAYEFDLFVADKTEA
jgi:hypothetical protein